jgi:hypothetical protein
LLVEIAPDQLTFETSQGRSVVFTKDMTLPLPQHTSEIDMWAMIQRRAHQDITGQPPVAQQPGATAYPPSTSPPQQSIATAGSGNDPASQIARLADMHVQGILTDNEFAGAKAKVLGM